LAPLQALFLKSGQYQRFGAKRPEAIFEALLCHNGLERSVQKILAVFGFLAIFGKSGEKWGAGASNS